MQHPNLHKNAHLGDVIDNPKSERIKRLKALSGRSFRIRNQRFLVEGPSAVLAFLQTYSDSDFELYVNTSVQEKFADLISLGKALNGRIFVITPQVCELSLKDSQGIAIVAPLDFLQRFSLTSDVFEKELRLIVVLANLRDPGNVGTLIRTADALGADAVLLSDTCVELANPKVIRASVGSVFHLPIVANLDLATTCAQLSARGVRILGADVAGKTSLEELRAPTGSKWSLADSTAWVFGNEAHGFADLDLDIFDALVKIPMRGRAESFNVATAASICLYTSAVSQA